MGYLLLVPAMSAGLSLTPLFRSFLVFAPGFSGRFNLTEGVLLAHGHVTLIVGVTDRALLFWPYIMLTCKLSDKVPSNG